MHIVFVIVWTSLLGACASRAFEAPIGPATVQRAAQVPHIRAVSDGWKSNEQIVHESISTRESILKSRRGITERGYRYRYYGDGSGSVSRPGEDTLRGWSINCLRDKMTDRRKCSIAGSNPVFVVR